MSKFLALMLALLLIGGQVCFADVQIDEGQMKGTAAKKFFVGRVVQDTYISKDKVVVWDYTSKDGFTVKTTTTSQDRLVAGITLDDIAGLSTDNTQVDGRGNNWGRIQTWGLYNNVKTASTLANVSATAGVTVCASAEKGSVGECLLSSDSVAVGVALETGSASSTLDMMVKVD